MNILDYIDLSQLVAPAIAISALAYLTRFFGKIIAEGKSFTDDRNWEIEINGIMFMINMSVGLVGTYLAINFPIEISAAWVHVASFVLVILLMVLMQSNAEKLSGDIYDLGKNKHEKLNDDQRFTVEFFAWLGAKIPEFVVPIILFYVATTQFMLGNFICIVLIFPLIFCTFIFLAIRSSLKSIKKARSDVYFTNDKLEPLMDVFVLRVTENQIRVRNKNKILLLNKDAVLKIETRIPEDLL